MGWEKESGGHRCIESVVLEALLMFADNLLCVGHCVKVLNLTGVQIEGFLGVFRGHCSREMLPDKMA